MLVPLVIWPTILVDPWVGFITLFKVTETAVPAGITVVTGIVTTPSETVQLTCTPLISTDTDVLDVESEDG